LLAFKQLARNWDPWSSDSPFCPYRDLGCPFPLWSDFIASLPLCSCSHTRDRSSNWILFTTKKLETASPD